MMTEPTSVLVLDDGELESVIPVLDAAGISHLRLRGGEIDENLPPPLDLLITTARHASNVRPGSPPGCRAGRPVRIIAVSEDSVSMRHMLRGMGFHLLVRQPTHPEVWRLLVKRALYQGDERRREPRLTIGGEVDLVDGREEGDTTQGNETVAGALLVDISNRGCHLVRREPFELGSRIRFTLTSDGLADTIDLSGEVVRAIQNPSEDGELDQGAAVIFDSDLAEESRLRLARLINARISGPESLAPARSEALSLPSTESPDMPGLQLDDETDPPVATEIAVELHQGDDADSSDERRERPRAEFAQRVLASDGGETRVLLGRDLSSGGMRIEHLPTLATGDRMRLALYGPSESDPIELDAEVVRDDGEEGMALSFYGVSREISACLEKFVACLPAVESLTEDEVDGMGAVISEILPEGR